ncbi:cysteine dioxygenase [Thiolapillus sp.]
MTDCKAKTWPAPEHLPQAALLRALAANLDDEARLLALAGDFHPSEDFPFVPHCYSRSLLLNTADGAQVMVARWDQGAATPIHGHPRYAFVYVLQGRLRNETFRDTDRGLVPGESRICEAGDHIYAAGREGRFDNAIHRVTALAPSLSLHVYSDDALKGISWD